MANKYQVMLVAVPSDSEPVGSPIAAYATISSHVLAETADVDMWERYMKPALMALQHEVKARDNGR